MVDSFIADLKDCVREAKELPSANQKEGNMVTVYGAYMFWACEMIADCFQCFFLLPTLLHRLRPCGARTFHTRHSSDDVACDVATGWFRVLLLIVLKKIRCSPAIRSSDRRDGTTDGLLPSITLRPFRLPVLCDQRLDFVIFSTLHVGRIGPFDSGWPCTVGEGDDDVSGYALQGVRDMLHRFFVPLL